MSFRERMQVGTSAAEIAVLIRLQKMHLIELMHPLGTTIVFIGGGAIFYEKECLPRQVIQKCQGFTVPDFPFLDAKMPTYLDGPPHLKKGVMNRDYGIDTKLRQVGLLPLRFAYKPKLSEERLQEICDTIKTLLEKRQPKKEG
ncbi:MAG: hypothetical protein E3J73_01120 [Candidatus Bathyarchaeum sp.]|nr:MAG: hypothetical protein E3J73_01120 [Candidatus Bathyarchaeum sp.]